MVFEHRAEYATQLEAIQSIAAKVGCFREKLRNWVRQAESDSGLRSGSKTQEQDRIRDA
jgi:transposase